MPNAYWMLGLVAVLSIVAAGAYPALVAAGLWETALQIPVIAGAIYTFIVARSENDQTEGENTLLFVHKRVLQRRGRVLRARSHLRIGYAYRAKQGD